MESLLGTKMDESLISGGRQITVEAFQPAGKGSHPAILVLHGAGGVDSNNAYVRQLAAILAAQGCGTFLVHYLNRTGHTWVNEAIIHSHFNLWLETLEDALHFIAGQPGVDETRIGCFGYSLGAYLALALASESPRIHAVVEMAGGIDDTHSDNITRLPPTLILHGSEDRRVPVSAAYGIKHVLQRLGVPYEMRIYPGEGHILRWPALSDAVMRGLDFLQRHLSSAAHAY